MLDVQDLIAAANADLAKVTTARLVGFGEYHVYLFANGIDELSRSGLDVRRLTYRELKALYENYGGNRRLKNASPYR